MRVVRTNNPIHLHYWGGEKRVDDVFDPPEPIDEEEGMLRKGDTIQCRDDADMIYTMNELAEQGIETDFLYEKDGQNGLWLVVTKGESE